MMVGERKRERLRIQQEDSNKGKRAGMQNHQPHN
jgi:hypothetical protein